jgi:hypothetical protein
VEPSFVEISVDATIAGTYTPGLDIITVPRSICFTEAAYGGGDRTIAVEAHCGGRVPVITTDNISATFANPPVGLQGIEDEQIEWSVGDTISIIIHAQDEGLDVAIDFSAVDSDYTVGDEIVTDLGDGDYEVEYVLSSVNTRSAGEYRLPVELSAGTVSRTYSDAVLVRYTPSPTGVIEFQDVLNGDFVFSDMPTGTYTGVSLTSALIRPQPGALATVEAEIWSENNLDGTALIVNAREAGTDGYASTEVWISGSTCSSIPPIGCVAEFEVPLAIRPSRMGDVADQDELDVELSFGLYTPTGPIFTAAELVPTPWGLDKAPPNTIAMSGRLLYERPPRRQGGRQQPQSPPVRDSGGYPGGDPCSTCDDRSHRLLLSHVHYANQRDGVLAYTRAQAVHRHDLFAQGPADHLPLRHLPRADARFRRPRTRDRDCYCRRAGHDEGLGHRVLRLCEPGRRRVPDVHGRPPRPGVGQAVSGG